MSETFHVTFVRKYQVPDDTDAIDELRDEVANEDSVYGEEDLAGFISSRNVLPKCDHCKSQEIMTCPRSLIHIE